MTTQDHVLLGAAMMLLKRHGAHAPLKVAERLGELATAGDEDGVAAWMGIARHMNSILHAAPEH